MPSGETYRETDRSERETVRENDVFRRVTGRLRRARTDALARRPVPRVRNRRRRRRDGRSPPGTANDPDSCVRRPPRGRPVAPVYGRFGVTAGPPATAEARSCRRSEYSMNLIRPWAPATVPRRPDPRGGARVPAAAHPEPRRHDDPHRATGRSRADLWRVAPDGGSPQTAGRPSGGTVPTPGKPPRRDPGRWAVRRRTIPRPLLIVGAASGESRPEWVPCRTAPTPPQVTRHPCEPS